MEGQINKQWLIAGNPAGRAVQEDDFKLVKTPLRTLEDGELLVKVHYLEFTPSLKGQMENKLSYAAKTEQGQVMRGRGIGRVVESRSEHVKIGQIVHGYLGWQEYALLSANDVKVLPDDEYARLHLGPLGSSGMAAYFGLLDVGKLKSGDTVIISGAAGGVGSIVGQIAKIMNCKVIGVAGGDTKCRHLIDGLKLDGAIDYKSEDLKSAMKVLAPNGFDVVFDNIGGEFLEAALGNLAECARIVICGAISRYETDVPPPGPTNYFNLVHKRATMQGFLSPYYKDRFPEAYSRIREWVESGKLNYFEDIQNGFENVPNTFMRLFNGKNLGKQLLKL
jgi:NADPH-dependent curcumin reductase CurA